MNQQPQAHTITNVHGVVSGSTRDHSAIGDLVRQIHLFAQELHAASATVQARAKGKKNYYSVKRRRQNLQQISLKLRNGATTSQIPRYLRELQHIVGYLANHTTPTSKLAQFCADHEYDLPAFDAALRLIDDAESIPGDQQLWWKPLANGTQPIIRFLPMPNRTPLYEHFIANSMTWREKCAIASGKKRKRGRTSK